jgi:hypothetical protein
VPHPTPLRSTAVPLATAPADTLTDPAEGDQLAFFRLMHEAFLEAEQQVGGSVEYDYQIGGQTVRLRFAGEAMIPRITRAFAHLAAPSTPTPELVVCLWDSASTGRRLPLLVSSLLRLLKRTWLEDRGVRGEILEYNSSRIRTALHGHNNNILSLLDLKQHLGVYWVADSRDIPWYETGAPLRTLLYWWFSHYGQQILHGGAVGTEAGGVLLAGRGNSGKSTTALASLDSSLLYAGDDYTLVATAPQPFVHSLYNTAKVKGQADLQRFPWMAARICNADHIETEGEKPMMFLHEHQPQKIISGFPLKALVLPRFIPGTEKCKVIPVAPESAFKAIAQSTIPQLTGAGSEALRAMSHLVHQVPCYLVGLGADLGDIPKVILELSLRQS